jgi:hypothetical protein
MDVKGERSHHLDEERGLKMQTRLESLVRSFFRTQLINIQN